MNQRTTFRWLILVQFGVLLGQQIATAPRNPDPASAPPPSATVLILGLALLAASIATLIGLWQFRRWSRPLFAALLVVSLAMVAMPITPLPPETPAVSAVLRLVWLSYGAQLVWMYGTSLANEFQPRAV